MQWPPAIRNYMRRVRLKYQHVIANFPLQTASLNTIEYTHACRKPQKHVYKHYKYNSQLPTSAFFHSLQLREKGGWDMLIFQPHPPHIITNSWRPLHDLSHLTIILRKARSPYQHVILKTWPPKLLIQIPLSTLVDNRTSEKHLHWTSQQPSECPPQLIQTLLL